MIIYQIVCNITGDRYIGSTKNSLNKRMSQHLGNTKRKTYAEQIFSRGNYQVSILEEGDFDRKEREQYYIDTLPNINVNDVNRNRASDTIQYQKQLREYKNSWGGDVRWNGCNLLNISLDLFK